MLKTMLLGAFFALAFVSLAHATPNGSLRIEVRGLDNAKGKVLCGLFVEKGWLEDDQRVAGASSPIQEGQATCVFEKLEPGTYGAVAFHDKNGNGRLDRNFLGIPTEDFCFSRNAKANMGPPSFDKAKLSVSAETTTSCSL